MNDTIVTVVGNVVDAPRRNNTQNGAVTNFRLASTARRYDAGSEQFVDSGTFWVDVECWNGLSGNVAGSLSKGDPVIVQGALTTHSWESESGPRSKPRIKAFAVGPNLAKGMSVFKRSGRPADAAGTGVAATGEPGPQSGAGPVDDHATPDQPVAGRDYVGDESALHPLDADDLDPEPAHA
ncbi:single-stranded DNA-binding protein [Blastococcus saxobsidens]|uniref:Single-strand DNA-binding protein n=1 Tax=Blastococcus saxobsidens TaxID=138336 RepID=A0A4Q7Y4J4_9ACTN|nr:single-stranded DNA-binding protein [Blastococcus saxobsidens]RZU30759.1 single-strand DNA-binding protein [Blastococcus saxobsidens]